ncbi:hypothetical protein [Thalassospira alkalitolerans]|uniref:hypothetical protein n=1 Tax=Thalassospira alkalitolerans TaxID=1293890 RepID=UPI003AA810EB
MKRVYFVLLGLATALAFTDHALAADKWTDQQDAIGQLWSGRSPAGNAQNFPVNQCNNWGALPQNVQAASTQTLSGLVVPSVSSQRAVVTNGLRQMAQSLHAYNVAQVAVGNFYPTDNINGPLNMDHAFWQGAGRSPHGNALDHLPRLNLAGLNNANCPANMNALNRQQIMDALDQLGGISNSQRWHCYSERFSMVGGAAIPLTGYVEFTQIEIPADNQYAYAAADGRIVYDYVNNRVYFTPAHYRQWKKADFAMDMTGNYGCTPGGSCCDPFFKITP